MGKEDNNNNATPNHQRRKAPPSLSAPGAHPSGGPSSPGAHRSGGPPADIAFGKVNGDLNTSYYGKSEDGSTASSATSPGISFHKGTGKSGKNGGGKGDKSMRDSTCTDRTMEESSIETSSAPSAIPLESDYFDRTIPEPRKQWVIPTILMAITAILAVVIPCVVILGRDPDGKQPHNMVRATPPPLPIKPNLTLAELQVIVPGTTQETLERIASDSMSPQALALQWVQNDPYSWDDYADWRKTQRFGMAVFFHSMGGPGWANYGYIRDNWMYYHVHECEWMKNGRFVTGSMCNEQNQLIVIRLPNLEYLRGAIPPEVAMLTNLQTLDIGGSQIGKDFDSLFQPILEAQRADDALEAVDLSLALPALRMLNLSATSFDGTIAPELGTLTGLTYLDLSQNLHIGGSIPSELGNLINLESLHLDGNQLTGRVPEELTNPLFLQALTLEENMLTEDSLPEALCSEHHISMLELQTDWCGSYEECCPAP